MIFHQEFFSRGWAIAVIAIPVVIALIMRARVLTRLMVALSGLAFYFAVEILYFAGAPVAIFIFTGAALALPLAAALSAGRRNL
jgi:hypothetical protein